MASVTIGSLVIANRDHARSCPMPGSHACTSEIGDVTDLLDAA